MTDERIYQSTEYFDSLSQAIVYTNQYFIDYNPKGYSTKITIEYGMLNDKWEVHIWRYSSCE